MGEGGVLDGLQARAGAGPVARQTAEGGLAANLTNRGIGQFEAAESVLACPDPTVVRGVQRLAPDDRDRAFLMGSPKGDVQIIVDPGEVGSYRTSMSELARAAIAAGGARAGQPAPPQAESREQALHKLAQYAAEPAAAFGTAVPQAANPQHNLNPFAGMAPAGLPPQQAKQAPRPRPVCQVLYDLPGCGQLPSTYQAIIPAGPEKHLVVIQQPGGGGFVPSVHGAEMGLFILGTDSLFTVVPAGIAFKLGNADCFLLRIVGEQTLQPPVPEELPPVEGLDVLGALSQ